MFWDWGRDGYDCSAWESLPGEGRDAETGYTPEGMEKTQRVLFAMSTPADSNAGAAVTAASTRLHVHEVTGVMAKSLRCKV